MEYYFYGLRYEQKEIAVWLSYKQFFLFKSNSNSSLLLIKHIFTNTDDVIKGLITKRW